MYVNGKMKPVETIPGMEEGVIKENERWGEFNCGIFDCKNFCKCHNVPSAQQ
jgi:hypothetical protein